MKVIIDFQSVEMTEEEHQYYLDLTKQLNKDLFKDIFNTDDAGFITLIKPKSNVPWIVLFFLQQLMISQRLRVVDNFMLKQESK